MLVNRGPAWRSGMADTLRYFRVIARARIAREPLSSSLARRQRIWSHAQTSNRGVVCLLTSSRQGRAILPTLAIRSLRDFRRLAL